ncbi:MAG: ABC-F family ATP-binding cassette domain-containing protein [Chthoniobacteraceae bacterium]
MLTLSNISKTFSGGVLFEEASMQINRGDRVGLVGANGAGKSTLFSIILREESPDEGTVSIQRGVSCGFLPQESAPVADETVLELATAISPEFLAARQTIRRCEAANDHDSHEYHEALHTFADMDGHMLNAKAKRILSGLAFRESDFDRAAHKLSGGWIMRAHLARLLVQEPDLLLLDEPTNHLDLESLVWFRDYLQGYPGAILMISHDRDFLNQLVTEIVEISRSRLHRYRGDYDHYLVEKVEREQQHLAAYQNQQKEIAKLQDFADRFRAKASKASQAQSKLKQIDRMEKIEAPQAAEAKVSFRFPQPQRSGQRVITLKDVDHAYGDLVVYRGLDFEAERGQRIVLVGPNGAGKSTLLKLLAEIMPVQSGTRELGHNVRAGYFAQHRVEQLSGRMTVLEAATDLESRPSEQMARSVLGSFLFRGDDVFKSVSVLSGGEKSRLALAKLLLDPPNLLLMDEPTTHLDIPSIDALIGALTQYEGTVIFISHDVHFIRALSKQVLHISAGKLTPYAGNYDYYLDKSKATSERAALVAGDKLENFQPAAAVQKPDAPKMGLKEIKEMRRAEAEARKVAAKAIREKQKRVTELEAKIHELEQRQAALTVELEMPGIHGSSKGAQLSRELTQVTSQIANAVRDWEREAEGLEDLPAEE